MQENAVLRNGGVYILTNHGALKTVHLRKQRCKASKASIRGDEPKYNTDNRHSILYNKDKNKAKQKAYSEKDRLLLHKSYVLGKTG